MPGAARSFFHRLAHARSGAPQQVWFPGWARSARNCSGCCSWRWGLPTLLQAISEWDLGSGRCRLDCSRRTQKLRRPRSRPAERGTGCSNEQPRHPSHTLSFLRHGQIYQSDVLMLQDGDQAFWPCPLFHRLDEFAVGYSLAGCSPALPASASPTGFIFILLIEAVKHRRRRLGSCAVEVSLDVATDKRFYPASALKSRFGATCRPSPARPARDDVPTLARRHIAGDFFCRN